MKKLIPLFLGGLAILCIRANAQEFKEHISKEFTLTREANASVLSIYNIDGPVRVEGYSGNKIIIEIDELITADDNQILETGKKEFRLGFDQTSDTVIAYIAAPYDSRPHRNWRDRGYDREIEYRTKLAYNVKVPFGINLDISTINDGDISVNGVTGTLHINNVNGSISVTGAKGTTKAHTVNGAVTVTYLGTPAGPCSYYTINGEINVTYPADLSADLQFKSMNGEFFTDFPSVEVLPAKVTKNQESRNGATIYKLNKITEVRIGSGGSSLKFETLNGNIYIKKQA
jgi:DUF4097 and DUF4098 domain-containing protein YvlB